MMQQSDELAATREKNKKFEAQELARKKAEEEDAKKYAETREPIAKDILGEFERVVAEAGLAPVSEKWKEMTRTMLTDNAPLSMENQAVTIACMRKIRTQGEELALAKARLLEAETAARTMHDMTKVDEDERNERRDLKAGRRNASLSGGSIMQPDTTEEDAPRALSQYPKWQQQMVMKSGYTGTSNRARTNEYATTQTRNVSAGRAAAPPPAAAAAPVVPSAVPVPAQQQQRTVTAGRTSAPTPTPSHFNQQRGMTLGEKNRMDYANPAFFDHLQNARQFADITTGNLFHMANQHMAAPGPLRWEN